jgi:hypothetical protein
MGEGVGQALRERHGPSRLIMLARAAAVAMAAALGLSGMARAQAPMKVSIETVGAWDQVATANYTFFVTAVPNSRITRAICAAALLRIPFSDIVKIENEGLKRWDIAPEHACVRLACHLHGSDVNDVEIAISANAPPRASTAKDYSGVSLRMKSAPDAAPVTLFERADIGKRSSDGAVELFNWSVSDKRPGPGIDYARVEIGLGATYAFAERLAARPKAIFEILPGEDRQIPLLAHEARSVEIGTAGIGEAVKRLKAMCPEMRRRVRGG